MSEAASNSEDIWGRIRAVLSDLSDQNESRQVNSAALAEKLSARAKLFRDRITNPQAAGPRLSILTFSVNGERYGLPIDSIVEIQPLDSYSFVPGAPDFIRGVVHFRGTILSLLDLTRLFGAREVGLVDIHFYVIATAGGRSVGITVSDVQDLKEVPISSIRSAPEWSGQVPANWIRGIYKEDCLILNLPAILTDEALIRWRGSP